VSAKVTFGSKVPKEFEVKLRFPKNGPKVKTATVNGKTVQVQQNEAVLVQTSGSEREFVVEASS
jgi:hypothetical protein